jgi:hypothetical protein
MLCWWGFLRKMSYVSVVVVVQPMAGPWCCQQVGASRVCGVIHVFRLELHVLLVDEWSHAVLVWLCHTICVKFPELQSC